MYAFEWEERGSMQEWRKIKAQIMNCLTNCHLFHARKMQLCNLPLDHNVYKFRMKRVCFQFTVRGMSCIKQVTCSNGFGASAILFLVVDYHPL